jgi:hypothetical protein
MFSRLKRALVESYVGAIGLGYLLAEAILHLANIVAWPVAVWVSRTESLGIKPGAPPLNAVSYKAELPELIRFIFISLALYVLLRWLYFEPFKVDELTAPLAPDQNARSL